MTFEEIKAGLRGKKVGIAGAGGLGSNCAAALLRAGVRHLVIADFDTVSESNLNRQFFFRDQVGDQKTGALKENLLRIDPEARIEDHPVRLVPENIPVIFAGCDVIVEAFDQAEEKQMLVETVLEQMPGIPLIIGVGLAGFGRNNAIHCRQSDNIYICGDEVSEIAPGLPPVAPRVGIVAHMQANQVLELLLGPDIL